MDWGYSSNADSSASDNADREADGLQTVGLHARVRTFVVLTVSPGAALMQGCWVLASDCRLPSVARTQS